MVISNLHCRYLIFILLTILSNWGAPIAFAQKTKNLQEVTVKAIRPERFMVGSKIIEIDSAALSSNRFSTVADFLQFNTSIAMKCYGAGQLATISMRGASASHTALLWNGLNINFPSLGLTDFSTIPMAAFDQMTIQFGSAASCVGTDAVGGSIQLRSLPLLNSENSQTQIGVRAESSKNYSGQAGIRFTKFLNNELRLSTKTIVYGSTFKNDFGSQPLSNKKGEVYNVEPTNTSQYSLVQDFFLQNKKGNLFALNIWLTDNNLTIWPDKIILNEVTSTKAYRLQNSYQVGQTLFKTAFIKDIIDYSQAGSATQSHTEIDRYIIKTEHDFIWKNDRNINTNLKVGFEFSHFLALVDGYGTQRKLENRADFYALFRKEFSENLTVAINLRQAIVSKYNPPFTPSIGVEYTLFKTGSTKIILPTNIGLSYRLPTLNERYWVNLGNPDIKPEEGFNKEMGANWLQNWSINTHTNMRATVFHNKVDNWTYWNPARNYRVENSQQVLMKGLELDFNLKTNYKEAVITTAVNYTLANSTQQKEFGAYTQDILGKQIIYVPRHVINNTISVAHKNLKYTIQQGFNSARYITFDHSGKAFPPYYILNASLNYQLNWAKNITNFSLNCQNLTNTLYPNVKKNAMPMRTLALSIIYQFKNNKI